MCGISRMTFIQSINQSTNQLKQPPESGKSINQRINSSYYLSPANQSINESIQATTWVRQINQSFERQIVKCFCVNLLYFVIDLCFPGRLWSVKRCHSFNEGWGSRVEKEGKGRIPRTGKSVRVVREQIAPVHTGRREAFRVACRHTLLQRNAAPAEESQVRGG